MNPRVPAIALCASLLFAGASAAADTTTAEQRLTSGSLAEAEASLGEQLKRQPDDDAGRFALGIAQFLRGVERLMLTLHANGLKGGEDGVARSIPILRLPVPPNPNPKTVAYEDLRAMLRTWQDDLARAEATLAGVKKPQDVKLPLRFGLVRFDFDGDGKSTGDEALWKIFARVQRRAGVNEKTASEFAIAFDGGDVLWLRGYCHLLSALCDVALAYDGQELFDATAQIFFRKVKSPFPFLQDGPKVADVGVGVDIVDAIAFVHLLRMPVKEPQRMESALGHLRQMIALSRESWKLILAESDNDREWIPNSRQKSVLPQVPVTGEMIEGWTTFLAEADDLLTGKRLAPFWRSKDGRGVNIKRVFTEPRAFDLVLWFQGTAAVPYLEEGELTRPEVWQNLMRVFRGDFFGYAVWFN